MSSRNSFNPVKSLAEFIRWYHRECETLGCTVRQGVEEGASDEEIVRRGIENDEDIEQMYQEWLKRLF